MEKTYKDQITEKENKIKNLEEEKLIQKNWRNDAENKIKK